MNNKKSKISILTVPFAILLLFLMASCSAKEGKIEVKPRETQTLEDSPQNAFSFKKLSDNLGDYFSYQKYDFSAVLPQGSTLDGFTHIQDINSTALYYWLCPKNGSNQLFSYNYTDRDAKPQPLFEFNWEEVCASISKVHGEAIWIWLANNEGNSILYKIDTSAKKAVFEANTSGIITFQVSDKYLFVSWREGKSEDGGETESGTFNIEAINLQNNERDTIAKTNFTRNKEGQYSGQVLTDGGMSADGQGYYYQVITLDSEYVEYQGASKLKYYSCESKETSDIMDMQKKIVFAYATKDYMLISEYVYDLPAKDTVKIYKMQDGRPVAYFAIPEIQNGQGGINQVVNVTKNNHEYLIFDGSNYYIYAYDLTNKTYVAYNYAKNYEEAQKYSIHIGEDAIRIVEYNENGPTFMNVYSLK